MAFTKPVSGSNSVAASAFKAGDSLPNKKRKIVESVTDVSIRKLRDEVQLQKHWSQLAQEKIDGKASRSLYQHLVSGEYGPSRHTEKSARAKCRQDAEAVADQFITWLGGLTSKEKSYITTLQLNDDDFTSVQKEALFKLLPNLTNLTLGSRGTSHFQDDAVRDYVLKLGSLRHFTIASSSISDKVFKHLVPKAAQLESVCIQTGPRPCRDFQGEEELGAFMKQARSLCTFHSDIRISKELLSSYAEFCPQLTDIRIDREDLIIVDGESDEEKERAPSHL